ncbi:MAG: CBS domain-containing protein [Pseudomonadota bacterium]
MSTVSDIMSRDIQVVSPAESVRTVAQKMKELDVGAIPVCEGKKLIGMITDRDIVIRVVADGKSTESTCARDVMSQDLQWCFEDQDLEEVEGKMSESQIRRLPVMNQQKELVGIISLGDLATQGQTQPAAEALRNISFKNNNSAVNNPSTTRN